MLTVPCLYIFETLKLIRNNLHIYDKHSDVHYHDTRYKANLRQTSHRTKIFEKSPEYTGIAFYNRLPQSLKGIKENSIFFREVKSMLINKAFYSITEYLQA